VSERFVALASHDFRRLLVGLFVSVMGSQMQRVAVAWQLYQLTGSPVALGLLGLARVAPVILLALGGGVLADALDRRRVMLVTQTVLGLVSLALAALTHADQVTPAVLYTAVAVAGVAVAFDAPARQSLVPLLVPREHLPNALGLNSVVFELGTVIGPAVAGVMIGAWGVLPIYVFDAVSFGVLLTAVSQIRHRTPREGRVRMSLSAVTEGLRFLGRERIILATMLLDFFATFFAGAMLLMPIVADQILGVGPEGLGVLYAAQPAGAALAAVAMSARGAIQAQGKVLLVAVGVYGVAIAGFGLSTTFTLSLMCLALSGAADCVSTVIRQTMRQLLTPDTLRGRMTSVNMMFFLGGPQLGELEAGLVAGVMGTAFAITSGGVACVVVAVVATLAVPQLRQQRLEMILSRRET
jgi:MFS family permease